MDEMRKNKLPHYRFYAVSIYAKNLQTNRFAIEHLGT